MLRSRESDPRHGRPLPGSPGHSRHGAAQDYLPPKVQEFFLVIVAEFVLLPWREATRSALADASQGGSQARSLACGLPQTLLMAHRLPLSC